MLEHLSYTCSRGQPNQPQTAMATNPNQFVATNSTDVTDTTAQVIKAAPTSSPATAQSYEIEAVTVTNKTAAELPVVILQDDDGNVLDTFEPGASGSVNRQYDRPRRVTAGKGIKAKATAAVGDTLVTVQGTIVPA